jgi:hypothetical protein
MWSTLLVFVVNLVLLISGVVGDLTFISHSLPLYIMLVVLCTPSTDHHADVPPFTNHHAAAIHTVY